MLSDFTLMVCNAVALVGFFWPASDKNIQSVIHMKCQDAESMHLTFIAKGWVAVRVLTIMLLLFMILSGHLDFKIMMLSEYLGAFIVFGSLFLVIPFIIKELGAAGSASKASYIFGHFVFFMIVTTTIGLTFSLVFWIALPIYWFMS